MSDEYASEYTDATEDARGRVLTIAIDKVGGGTVGRAYEGTWRYVVWYQGEEIARGEDLYTGMPKTHAQALEILADFMGGE